MKRLFVVLALVLVPLSAIAQRTEVFAFADDPTVSDTATGGRKIFTGYGLSLRHFTSPRLSTELSIARHYQYGAYFYPPAGDVAVPPQPFRARVLPIDLIESYHFAPGRTLQPYAGIGLHYLTTLDGPGLESQTRFEVAGGVVLRLTPHAFLRADIKRLLGGSALHYDPVARTGVGLGWRF